MVSQNKTAAQWQGNRAMQRVFADTQ